MSLERCVTEALRAAMLLGLALAAMPFLRRAPAAMRRLLLAIALGGTLVLPAVSALVPAWHVGPRPSFVASREPTPEPTGESLPARAVAHGERGPAAAAPKAAVHAIDLETALGIVWAIGALLVAARLAAGLVGARAMARKASPAVSWARAIAQAEIATGVRADVRLSDAIDAPAVTGVFAHVVLVPRASQGWADARRVSVLHHEIAHVKQMDCLSHVL